MSPTPRAKSQCVRLPFFFLSLFTNCLEGEFSEVRGSNLPRLAPSLYQSGRGRATFRPLPRPYLLRLVLGSDTSSCDLLQPGLPRIPALPHPDKPCSYQDDQRRGYPSVCPSLYNAHVVGRVVLPPLLGQRGRNIAPSPRCAGSAVARP